MEPNLQAQVRPLEEIAKYAEVCFYCGVTQTVGYVDPKCSSSVSFSRCAHVRSPHHPIHTHDVSSPREVPWCPLSASCGLPQRQLLWGPPRAASAARVAACATVGPSVAVGPSCAQPVYPVLLLTDTGAVSFGPRGAERLQVLGGRADICFHFTCATPGAELRLVGVRGRVRSRLPDRFPEQPEFTSPRPRLKGPAAPQAQWRSSLSDACRVPESS